MMTKYGVIAIGVIFSTLAQVALKKTSMFEIKQSSFFIYFGLAGLFYLVSFGLYVFILKQVALNKVCPVMTIATMILVVVASLLMFNESLSTKQLVGIACGIISVVLVIG